MFICPTLSQNSVRFISKGLVPALFAGFSLLSGCKDVSSPEDTNEIEVFTTVTLMLTQQGGTSDETQATIRFKDGFGHGDALEKNDTLKIMAGATYSAELVLLNESASPAEVMSEEVKEEGVDHQVFYSYDGDNGSALTVDYADMDANHHPIGLLTTFKAGSDGNGILKVTLKHQPGLKSATSTIATGETDVEVSFHVTIR